jgi:hypothetical protein
VAKGTFRATSITAQGRAIVIPAAERPEDIPACPHSCRSSEARTPREGIDDAALRLLRNTWPGTRSSRTARIGRAGAGETLGGGSPESLIENVRPSRPASRRGPPGLREARHRAGPRRLRGRHPSRGPRARRGDEHALPEDAAAWNPAPALSRKREFPVLGILPFPSQAPEHSRASRPRRKRCDGPFPDPGEGDAPRPRDGKRHLIEITQVPVPEVFLVI